LKILQLYSSSLSWSTALWKGEQSLYSVHALVCKFFIFVGLNRLQALRPSASISAFPLQANRFQEEKG